MGKLRASCIALVLVTVSCATEIRKTESTPPSEYALEESRQGRVGAWASAACPIDDGESCRIACASRNLEACNNWGITMELRGGPANESGAAGMYHLACTFGVRGACYNEARVNHGLSFLKANMERGQRMAADGMAMAANANALVARLEK
jgi:hypothetical protein